MALSADSPPIRVGIIAGETSGDLLGAGLMSALRAHWPNVEFEGIGGARMEKVGFHSLFAQERLAVMGLVEPLKRLPELLRMRRALLRHFTARPPTVFIGIDSPEFNLDLELWLREAGILTVHYVSPSVWAWRQGRVKKIARAVDLMLTLFPFEQAFYQRHKVPVRFVGHPLADQIELVPDAEGARAHLNLTNRYPNRPLVALLPGSRGGEVARLGPTFLAAARVCHEQLPDVVFVVPSASEARHAQLQKLLDEQGQGLPVELIRGQSHEVMAAADVVLITSGTATLEALLLKRPMVIAWQASAVTFWILSRLVKLTHIGLPNLLAQREIVPEFVQTAAQPEALASAVVGYLDNPDRVEALQQVYRDIHLALRRDADVNAADAVRALVEQKGVGQ